MSGEMDVVEFLRARLDEDERTARLADTPARWEPVRGDYGPKVTVGSSGGSWERECPSEVWRCDDPQDGCTGDAAVWMAEAHHIARHDPARVLADVAAKRAIVDAFLRTDADDPEDCFAHYALDDALRQLATVYAEHPDYREEWRP